MKSILIIGCYFGSLRQDTELFIKSIKNNPTIDWAIISDCEWNEIPDNMRIIKKSFKELKNDIQDHFEFKVALEAPYKLCDFKPAYGEIFGELTRGYDFWGHCDFDMLFGDLRKFFTEEKLDHYDRVYHQGHLCLYKNIPSINNLYKSEKGKIYYKEVFSNKKNYVFDEVNGMYYICINEKINFFKEVEYADIFPYLNVWLHPRQEYKISEWFPQNKRYQVFGYRDGKILKWSKEKKNAEIKIEEFAYLHFSHKILMPTEVGEDFFITKNGLTKMDEKNIPFECYCKVLDNCRMNLAELLYRINRKIRKITEL